MMKPLLPLLLASALPACAATFLVEAEQFNEKGGWEVDTQFIETMGSPYLIAHGLGKTVSPAFTDIKVPQDGNYRVWVRTLDWTKRLGRAAGAGRFKLTINGQTLAAELGEGVAKWTWQEAGKIDLKAGRSKIILNDLTGFDGRADAILFSSDDAFQPPPDATFEERTRWNIPGVPSQIEDAGEFDLVVIGGGYGGLGSAISAARMGAKVALIQDRRVLGGNGSSEIRVWAAGAMPPGEYPFSDIVREITDRARASPTGGVEFGDSRKQKVVDLEKNITLFLGHHAYGLDMQDGKIQAVKAADVEVGRLKKIRGRFFADCTGHGFVGLWSGADTAMAEKGRMGMSNQWLWEEKKKPVSFPEQPWMYKLTDKDFPYPRIRNGYGHAQWFWESGYDDHPIRDLETTRDWNLVTCFSAWNSMKNHGAHAERDPNGHRNAEMVWLAYIGGTRETLQILGDVVLTGDDIRNKKQYQDGTVLSTWSIDLHIPNPLYENAIPERKFLSKAVHDRAIDKKVGYPIPYRSFYSRNVPNLFMAGRNISVDRDALGTVRVMKTVGQMGVAVGRAAALATATDSTPRGIYTDHLDAAKKLWKLPGDARFENIDDLRKFVEGDKPPL